MRVRFAPSPTGQLHVGNVRTALFNWLLARGSGRDVHPAHRGHRRRAIDARVRSRRSSTTCAGSASTGTRGRTSAARTVPTAQSERLHLYQSYASELLERRRRVLLLLLARAARSRAPGGGRRRAVPRSIRARAATSRAEQAQARVAAGERPAIRFRVPENRDVVFSDVVRGEVRFQTDVIGDPVIVRADGIPAYNFAVVVDDALMEVTHVIRGEDHISNTPRQILLYEALGFTPPAFAHLALVHGARSQPAVEASRRDVGRRVPREGIPAGGAASTTSRSSAGRPARRRRAAAGRGAGAAVLARARRPQRRRVRRREAGVGEPALLEDGRPGAARRAVGAVSSSRPASR